MRLNESRTRSFQAPVTIHNYPGRQVYVFPSGRSDSEESSEEELNVTELRPRGKEQQRCSTSRDRVGDVVLLEREITEDDNLNKLALQYGCKVRAISVCLVLITLEVFYVYLSIQNYRKACCCLIVLTLKSVCSMYFMNGQYLGKTQVEKDGKQNKTEFFS